VRKLFAKLVFTVLTAASLSACQSWESRDFIEATASYGALPNIAMPVAFDPTARNAIPEHGEAAKPLAYVSFCVRMPDQCAMPADQTAIVHLTPEIRQTLTRVNFLTNQAIIWQSDAEHYDRQEYWTISTDGKGDCEDYALAKRKALMEAGLPARALRLAVVRIKDGDLHVVLTVATDHGDYVLDNRNSDIRAWNATDLEWVSRQDPNIERGWVSLQPGIQQVPTHVASLALDR